jgi:prevent-host-death family protein
MMTTVMKVSKSQLKAKALEYFRHVERTGEVLVITDRGRPVLQITPYEDPSRRIESELRESVVRYEAETAPVGLDDWGALEDEDEPDRSEQQDDPARS